MARKLELSPVEEKQIEIVWNCLIKKYPILIAEDSPIDFTFEDWRDEIILGLTPDVP